MTNKYEAIFDQIMETIYLLTKSFLVVVSLVLVPMCMFIGPIIPMLYIKDFKFDLVGIILIIINSFLCVLLSLSFGRIVMSSSDKWRDAKDMHTS